MIAERKVFKYRDKCASCQCWNPEKMTCNHVPNEPAPPDSGCGGWVPVANEVSRRFWFEFLDKNP